MMLQGFFKPTVPALSSESYYIRAGELKKLVFEQTDIPLKGIDTNTAVVLLGSKNKLIGGQALVDEASETDFIKTIIVYRSYLPFLSFFINLIKPLKRHFYLRNNQSFTVRLDKLLEADLTRGIRNAENAYQWTNKKWSMSREAAKKKYHALYNSLKNKGYNSKYPMYVMLNRKFGIKDQLLQGHHRINICRELGLETVNISFWAAPASFKFLKKFF